MQTQGEHENSAQKGPDLAMNQKTVMLLGDSDNHCTTVPTREHDFNLMNLINFNKLHTIISPLLFLVCQLPKKKKHHF